MIGLSFSNWSLSYRSAFGLNAWLMSFPTSTNSLLRLVKLKDQCKERQEIRNSCRLERKSFTLFNLPHPGASNLVERSIHIDRPFRQDTFVGMIGFHDCWHLFL